MFDLSFFRALITGSMPMVQNLRLSGDDALFFLSLAMGVLIIGRQGTGKTSYLAKHLLEYLKKYRRRAVFILDWSGSLTNALLALILMEPQHIRDSLLSRVIYDELGNPDYVIPLPEFSERYGNYEDQVQRVSGNLIKLAPDLVQGAPFVAGLGLKEIGPQIFRLLTAIRGDYNECWQITEAKKLIVDKGFLRQAVNKFGNRVPEAKWFIEKIYTELSNSERELRTYALNSLLGAVETPSVRAKIGYPIPGWTPKEAIENGRIVIVNADLLNNQENAQHYLFTQIYSLIIAEIRKRTPSNPDDEPVSLVMDEVYSLLSIPGMAKEVGTISPLYRNKGLQLYVVLQSLSQLAEPLDKQIWSLGNKVAFALENKAEAEEIAYQLCRYDPHSMKLPARNSSQNPVSEPEHGQDRQVADWIQNFKFRECIMQKFLSERQRDPFLRYIPQTSELNHGRMAESVQELKERLLKAQGISVKLALNTINNRKLPGSGIKKPPQL